jgi:hypothetical protein
MEDLEKEELQVSVVSKDEHVPKVKSESDYTSIPYAKYAKEDERGNYKLCSLFAELHP